jgi:alcohol dehydrogenase class IV
MIMFDKSQEAYIGESALEQLSAALKKKLPRNIFLVSDKDAYEKSGAKELLENLFNSLNISVTAFFDFSVNPKIEDVERGLLSLPKDVDLIIAIGGGSVIDTAKLIRFFNAYSGNFMGVQFKKEKELIPFFALPTTAGTGSEATHFAVVYSGKTKYSVAHKDILPDAAFVYPPFTYSASPYLTATTGFDFVYPLLDTFISYC